MTDYGNNHRQDNIHHADSNRRPEEIESDIERTRAEVSSTLEAIQSKLTPGQMMDQAFAYARTSLPADFSANLSNTIRENPVPMALIGVGIAWMMMSGQQSNRRAGAYDQSMSSQNYSGTGRSMKDSASEMGHRVSDSASAMTGRAREMTHSAKERIHDATHNAQARVSDLSHRSQEQYYRTRDNFSRMADEQPLMLGTLGLALGALLGAALPRTQHEDELMGRTRDDLLDQAKHTAREQADHMKESAQRVAQVAKEEAQHVSSGMTANSGQSTGDGLATGTNSVSSPTPAGTPGQYNYH